ncbi:MAG: phospholipase D family protein [Pseudomonadota bacterium]|nr:phospholipase D family protein [Pseudomonadota bacterium]
MDSAVVSEHLGALLDRRDVMAAVFTTYTFDPEFFELEIIPLLLPGNTPFSSDSRVKQFQVREALRESTIDLEVFYDLSIYRKEGNGSPGMEYLFHGVHRGNDAFHAKIAMVLVDDKDNDCDCLLVGAGSCNLTRAGWWDNIECQHWEVIRSGEASRAFLNRLEEDVVWLQAQRLLDPAHGTTALEKIGNYLRDCKSRRQAKSVGYYGIHDIDRKHDFPGFIRRQAREHWVYSNWTLEIISPFFAEDAGNREHEFFFDLGVREIHLLLPMDQEGSALCQREYFDHIDELEGIRWAEWSHDTAGALGLSGQTYRRLHAKVYHFYNGKQSWAFVGSVNFSHKAMRENIEAGFFVKLDTAGALLKPIQRPQSIEKFEPPTDLLPGTEGQDSEEVPRIYLSYDWSEQRLTGITGTGGYTISILTPEGHSALTKWPITNTVREYNGSTKALEELLRNGSLVKVTGFETGSGKRFPSQPVMLMQTGWTHKPMDLPDLTPEQILAIYAGMTPDRRQLLLMNAQIRKLVLEGTAGDMSDPADESAAEQFFSEYAEIFHAFRRLKKRLSEASAAENHPVVDYYLTGSGVDSLPTLLDRVADTDSTVNPVTAYLLLLCAYEIYKESEFRNVRHIKRKLTELGKRIKAIRSSDSINLEDDSPRSRKAFFTWFETQFFRNYRVADVNE